MFLGAVVAFNAVIDPAFWSDMSSAKLLAFVFAGLFAFMGLNEQKRTRRQPEATCAAKLEKVLAAVSEQAQDVAKVQQAQGAKAATAEAVLATSIQSIAASLVRIESHTGKTVVHLATLNGKAND